jgi:hypothetical protein
MKERKLAMVKVVERVNRMRIEKCLVQFCCDNWQHY